MERLPVIILEKTQEEVKVDPFEPQLISRRKEGEGLMLEINGERVLLIVEQTRRHNAMLRVYASEEVRISRVETI